MRLAFVVEIRRADGSYAQVFGLDTDSAAHICKDGEYECKLMGEAMRIRIIPNTLPLAGLTPESRDGVETTNRHNSISGAGSVSA